MRPFQQGSPAESFALLAVLALLLSGIYVPVHAAPTTTKASLDAAASPHTSTPHITETPQESTHSPASQVKPSVSSLGQATVKSVQGANSQSPPVAPSPPVHLREKDTADSRAISGPSAPNTTVNTISHMETQLPSDSVSSAELGHGESFSTVESRSL